MTTETVTCSNCDAANSAARQFCADCGSQLHQREAPARPASFQQAPSATQRTERAPYTTPTSATSLSGSDILNEVQTRAKERWLPLIAVLILTLLDWRLHDDVGVSILLGIVGALGVLYYPEIYERLRAQFRLEQYGDEVKTLLITSPVALFFMLRGRGVSVPGFGLDLGAGLLVAIVLVGGAVALRHVMPSIDVSLQGFYRTRDQYLPPPACIGVMVLLSVLFTFGLVHGELGDVAVILGQDSDKLDGPSLGNMLIIVLANMALAVAFLRRAPQ